MTRSSPSTNAPRVLTLDILGFVDAVRAGGFDAVGWPAGASRQSEALTALASDIDAIVTIGQRGLPDDFLDAAAKLGLIICVGAGFDSYDPAALAARGVRLANGAGTNAIDVAELAFGLLIAAQRRIVTFDGDVRAGLWDNRSPLTHRLAGRKLGILGLGPIGLALAVRAEAFGMIVGWSGRRPKPVAWDYFADPAALARWCDALVICARPTPENAGLADETLLNALGPDGVLVNVARGSLVDEGALIAALRDGRLRAAALDVFAQEPTDASKWQGVPNLTLHPHRGAGTHEATQDSVAMALENLRRHFAGEPLLNPLN